MAEYIDRDAAYNSILNGMVMTGYQSRALDCISEFSVPAADAAPVVHGRWEKGIYGSVHHICSVCRFEWFATHTTNYCPNCGAKMDEEVIPE